MEKECPDCGKIIDREDACSYCGACEFCCGGLCDEDYDDYDNDVDEDDEELW